jgi:hypothetical protein
MKTRTSLFNGFFLTLAVAVTLAGLGIAQSKAGGGVPRASGKADGKIGSVYITSTRNGRLLFQGSILTDRPPTQRQTAEGYVGCTLFVGGKTIDLPVIKVAGHFEEFFDIQNYPHGTFTVALWSKRVVGQGSYDAVNGYHMEGRIASVDGKF